MCINGCIQESIAVYWPHDPWKKLDKIKYHEMHLAYVYNYEFWQIHIYVTNTPVKIYYVFITPESSLGHTKKLLSFGHK